MITVLDVHKSVDSYEELHRQALAVDSYGTFQNPAPSSPPSTYTSFPEPRDVDYASPRAFLVSNLTYFRDRMLALVSLENYAAIGPMVFWEKLLTAVVVLSGLTATVLSTFFSVRGAIEYATFVPPCIVNVTLASKAVIDDAF